MAKGSISAPSALQKVGVKHLQSPLASHHMHITVLNHRITGQVRAPAWSEIQVSVSRIDFLSVGRRKSPSKIM
jgi:hypothetical protein